MNLKRIEIMGFKSFADKVVIDFNDGFTCVIGPNGCGKSNVADAIRWTLGEQSARVLRGQKMMDVIFHGTVRRKPLPHCEVSLVFDNSTRHYPIDYDEVTITRKLYRSNVSEYYINKKPTRLKDIVELFRDTGIGREGYSIIGQGAITEILSIRPDDRRHIFEEAAGITKFRIKREEAEKSLAGAKANLDLASYRKNILEADLAPLAEQSEKAKKAKELKDKLRTLEVNTFIYQNEHNSSRKSEIQRAIDIVKGKIAEVSLDSETAQASYDKLGADIAAADKDKNDLHERFAQIRVSHEQANSRSSNARTRLEDITNRKLEYAAEVLQKEALTETAKTGLAEAKAEKEEQLKEYVEIQKEESVLSAEVEEIRIKQRDKTREIDEINRLILSSSDQKGIVGAEKASLKVKIDNLTESIEKNKTLRDELKAGMNSAKKELEACREKANELNTELAKKLEQKKQIEAQHLAVLTDKDKSEDLLKRVEGEINRLVGEIKTSENILKSNSQYSDGVRNLLNSGKDDITKRIVSLVGIALTIPTQLHTAMEIALGRSAQNIITENEDDTEYLLNYLKTMRGGGGRATCLAITKIMPRELHREYRSVLEEEGCLGIASDLVRYDRKFKNIMSFLLGSVVIVENMAAGRRLSNKYRNSFRIVTLDGEDFAPGGATTGGSAPSGENSIFARENALKEKKKLLEANEKRCELLSAEIKKCNEDITKLARIAGLLQVDCQKLDKDYSALAERNKFTEVEILKHGESIAKLEFEISADQKTLKEAELQYSLSTSGVDRAESDKLNANELLERSRREFGEGESVLNAKVKQLSELNLRINTLKNKIDNLTGAINTFESDLKRYQREILETKSKIATNDAQLAQVQEELLRSQLSDSEREELETVKNLMEESDKKKEKLRHEQSKCQKLITELSKTLSDLNVERTLAENKLINLDEANYLLSTRIKDEYGLDEESAKQFKIEDFDVQQSENDIKKLKRDLARLGEINETAVEQYGSKKEEFDKLVNDYNDVLKTINEIQGNIDELTAVMEKNFIECFEKVNENFKEIFAEIFDNGKGYLELDLAHGESVLDAGIEIFAEPGGKKIQHISLLSGGERALTAIAILFSIIKLKPMPFCVLDEIEAALDDSNAYLFAKFLRKYCNLTQFLVISHRKPTMELADTLFGITMEEKGVSQFFSANMRDVDRILSEE